MFLHAALMPCCRPDEKEVTTTAVTVAADAENAKQTPYHAAMLPCLPICDLANMLPKRLCLPVLAASYSFRS